MGRKACGYNLRFCWFFVGKIKKFRLSSVFDPHSLSAGISESTPIILTLREMEKVMMKINSSEEFFTGKLKNAKNFLAFFLINFVVLYFIYSSVLLVSYLHWDDAMFFVYGNRTALHPLTYFLLRIGRPLCAALFNMAGFLINFHKVGDLRYLRFISFLFIVLSAALFSLWINKKFFSKWIALAITIVIFTTPGFQAILGYASNFHIALGLAMALIAFLMIDSAYEKSDKLFCHMFPLKYKLCIGLIILLSAAFTYPIAMFFVTVMLFCKLVFSDRVYFKSTLLYIFRLTIILGIVAVFYFVINALLIGLYYAHFPQQVLGNYQFVITRNMIVKWQLFESLTIKAFNLWYTIPSSDSRFHFALYTASFVISVAMISFIYDLYHKKVFKTLLLQYVLYLLTAILLMIVSVLPDLMAQGGFSIYRILVSYSCIVVIAVIWGLFFLSKLVARGRSQYLCAVLVCILAFVGAVLAQNTMLKQFALNGYLELAVFRASIIHHLKKNVLNKIYVVPPLGDTNNYVGKKMINDEFGISTSCNHPYIGILISVALGPVAQEYNYVVFPQNDQHVNITKEKNANIIIVNMNHFIYPYNQYETIVKFQSIPSSTGK